MNNHNLLKRSSIIIGGILALLVLLSFYIRTTPAFLGNIDVLMFVGMDDPTYQLRRIEQVIANYPNVPWFDPMTYFPYGQQMHWGPLFPFLGATICLLAGAVTRPEIISVSLFLPCVLAALLVPIVYLLVSRIADWKAGLFAAFFIAIMPGQFFSRSFYGYLDHHAGEVFFSTLFCLCYILALMYCRRHPVDIKNRETWKIPALLGVLCGISYTLGLALMPTMLLFALLVGIFTPIWFIIQRSIGHYGASALLINTVTFLVAIIGFFIIGIHAEGGLNYYTTGHPIAYSLLIIANVLLFSFSYALREKPVWYYVGAILGVTVLGIVSLAALMPDLFQYLLSNAVGFFGSSDIHWQTIREARPWEWEDAWRTFNYSLVLFCLGLIVLAWRIRKELCPSHAFTLLWSIVILYATSQHIRYEYYLAVPVAILGGIAVGFALDLIKLPGAAKPENPDAGEQKTPDTKKKLEKGKGKHSSTRNQGDFSRVQAFSYIFLGFVLLSVLLFSFAAIGMDLKSGGYRLNQDWRMATEWLEKNTPDPGIDYLAIYEKENFTYPDNAYGVMSWWDYGHIITLLGKRIPNANPFQYGVDGPNGSARFLLAQNESEADQILDNLNTRYVITDIDMDTGYLNAISIWDNPEVGIDPYQKQFLFPNQDGKTGVNYSILTDDYYHSMVSRLHNFDGSYVEPGEVYFFTYMKPEKSGISIPVIIEANKTSYMDGRKRVESFNASTNPGYGVILANFVYTDPVSPVSSLQHYRLIYESDTRTTPADMPDLRYVKIFEYVKGAKIPGEGMLELPVRTNTGREFVYLTTSVNGIFTVPYPTDTTVGAVTVTGPYRNTITGDTFSVSEEQVSSGLPV
ncbi:MAG: oligosaccharyl transferase, archaeosortase A system-associated [Methanomicrobiales archaeon]|nr:oligosaccharyl transferase, archaeosortase A system-associated [Methanomicrobiales archaeon]